MPEPCQGGLTQVSNEHYCLFHLGFIAKVWDQVWPASLITLVSNIFKAVPIFLFWNPNGFNELPEVLNFSSN